MATCVCVQLTLEEVMTTTAYLDLFLRSVTEPALLQTLLSFVLLHQHEGVHILDTLVSRINTPFQVRTFSAARLGLNKCTRGVLERRETSAGKLAGSWRIVAMVTLAVPVADPVKKASDAPDHSLC